MHQENNMVYCTSLHRENQAHNTGNCSSSGWSHFTIASILFMPQCCYGAKSRGMRDRTKGSNREEGVYNFSLYISYLALILPLCPYSFETPYWGGRARGGGKKGKISGKSLFFKDKKKQSPCQLPYPIAI